MGKWESTKVATKEEIEKILADSKAKKETYNGWKNRQTWSCALWISNDEFLYKSAVAYMQKYPNSKCPYSNFIRSMGMQDSKTPDGIKWISTRISYSELNAMMRELVA